MFSLMKKDFGIFYYWCYTLWESGYERGPSFSVFIQLFRHFSLSSKIYFYSVRFSDNDFKIKIYAVIRWFNFNTYFISFNISLNCKTGMKQKELFIFIELIFFFILKVFRNLKNVFYQNLQTIKIKQLE